MKQLQSRSFWIQILFFIAPILISFLISALMVMALGRNPIEVAEKVWEGAFRNQRSFAGVLNFWIPLTLVSMGLVVTFRAGLWNIGIEGQMMMGVIFAAFLPQFIIMFTGISERNSLIENPIWLIIILSLIFAMVGGMLWAGIAAFLKIKLGINEIFGGMALNALADVMAIYLISGPWEPPEGGSAQATAPFPELSVLPTISSELPTNLLMLILVILASLGVILALRGTRWGLQLKATGKNARSALLLGVPTDRTTLSAFLVCGALAGLAGSYRTLFTYDSLRPLASGGIGFLGLLVVLLATMQPILVPIISFGFSILLPGSTRLRVSMGLDSSLAQVLQGMLVLFMLLSSGLRQRFMQAQDSQPDIPQNAEAIQMVGD